MTRLDEAIRLLDDGKRSKAQEILEQLRVEEPDNHLVLYDLGRCYMWDTSTCEAAIEVLERCIQLAPDFVKAYYRLGAVYKFCGRTREAVNVLEIAREKEPEASYVLEDLGSLYNKQGRFAEAIECFELVRILRDGEYLYVNYGLAKAYEHEGRLDEADRLYKDIISIGEPGWAVRKAKEGRKRIRIRRYLPRQGF